MSIFKKNKKKQFSTYAELVNTHIDKLFAIAYRYTNNKADAEDLIQDLVLKLQPKFPELQALDNPQVWMTKVLYNLFIDSYRRNSRSPITLISNLDSEQSNVEYFDRFQSEESNPVDAVESHQLINQLDAALNQLSEQDRMMVILYEIEGYSIRELQEIVDMPAGSVKSKLSRARYRLRDLLKNATKLESSSCKQVRG